MKIKRVIAQLEQIVKKQGDLEAVIEIYDEETKEFRHVRMDDISVDDRPGFGNCVGFLV